MTNFTKIKMQTSIKYKYMKEGKYSTKHLPPLPKLKSGGQIHIKKKNRGKFTESANKAGKSVQEFAKQVLANKERYSPTLVKRANFARNASKWRHQFGGTLENIPKLK